MYCIFVSETYSIWDTLFHDEMTPYDSSKWSSTITPVQETDGVIITESTGTNTSFSAQYTAIDEVIIEFDAIGVSMSTNGARFYYRGGDNYIRSYLSDSNEHHFKFVCSNGTITTYVDGSEKTSRSTSTNTTCRFILNNASIKLRNFKIYPV